MMARGWVCCRRLICLLIFTCQPPSSFFTARCNFIPVLISTYMPLDFEEAGNMEYFNMVSPLFLAFFLFFHLHISAQESMHPNSISCPESFQCPGLGLLKFPFTKMLQAGCGLSPINCDFQPPKIKLSMTSDQWFDVQRIEPGNLIGLFDPVLQDHIREQSCESFNHEIKILNSNSISFSVLSNVVKVFKCSNQMNLSQEATDYFNNHGFRKYESCEGLTVYYGNPNGSFDSENPSSCPVAYFPVKSTDAVSESTDLFKLMTPDFQIGWRVSQECQACFLTGGQCATDRYNQFLCLNGEREHDRNDLRIIVAVSVAAVATVLIVAIFVICYRRIISRTEITIDQNKSAIAIDQNKNSISVDPKKNAFSIDEKKNAISVDPSKNAFSIDPDKNSISVDPNKNAISIDPNKNSIYVYHKLPFRNTFCSGSTCTCGRCGSLGFPNTFCSGSNCTCGSCGRLGW